MKKYNAKISLRLLLSSLVCTVFLSCNAKKVSIMSELIPIALKGGSTTTGNSRTSSSSSTSTSSITTDSSISLPDSSSSSSSTGSSSSSGNSGASCPIDVASGKAAAILCITSLQYVDRYKSLDIQFSEAVNQSTVQSAFQLVSAGGPLPGPAPGGTFLWLSPTRLIFDPFRELSPSTTYTLSIAPTAKTQSGKNLNSYLVNFTTEHDYYLSMMVNSIALGGNNDVSLSQSTNPNLTLAINFINTTNACLNVQSIQLYKVNAIGSITLTCSPSMTVNTLNSSAIPPTQGGNAYYVIITTQDGKTFRRSAFFNWGNVNTNPSGLVAQSSGAVLDQAQMMPFLGAVLQRFTAGAFKIQSSGQNLTFNDFMTGTTSSSPSTPRCINYTSFTSLSYLRSYGDGSPNGDGYCNPKFVATASLTVLFVTLTAQVEMDVYVTGVSLSSQTAGLDSVAAGLSANADGEMGIDLQSRTVVVNLGVIANFRDNLDLIVAPAGTKMHFTTTATLNVNKPASLRLSRTRNNISVDSSGNISITVKTPYASNDNITQNFYIQGWTNPWDGNCWTGGSFQNGDYDYNRGGCPDNLFVDTMVMQASTSWAADFVNKVLPSMIQNIANAMVPSVKANITQSMLKDVIQRIAPNVMNSVVGSLKNPGITLALPNYLPAPLANYPLTVKLGLQTDAMVRNDGINKGLVSSADVSITSSTIPAQAHSPTPRGHSSAAGFVYYKPTGPLFATNTLGFPFNQSNANPGLLLVLHPDLITQASYHLWKYRALDLDLNNAFITTINQYAGANPLFNLTQTLLKAGPIISILAPGQTALSGIDLSNNIIPPISASDDITMVLDPIQAPVVRLIPLSSGTGYAPLQADFTGLQLTIQGKRADNSIYVLSTIRVSMTIQGAFQFVAFSNPTNNPSFANLNALSVTLDPNNMSYVLDVLEGSTYNPYGFDPNGIRSVMDPLVKSLVVPLINNVLKEIPLPPSLPMPILVDKNAAIGASSPASCVLNVKNDAATITNLPTPANTSYLLGRVYLQGTYISNPGALVVCP